MKATVCGKAMLRSHFDKNSGKLTVIGIWVTFIVSDLVRIEY